MILSLAKRVIHQIKGDKRSVALILFAPLLVLTLIYFLLTDSGYTPTIAMDEKKTPQTLVSALHEQDAIILDLALSDLDKVQYLKENKEIDAILTVSQSGAEIYMLEASAKSGKAMEKIQKALQPSSPAVSFETHFVFGRADESTFDTMGYIFLGMFSFFFVFILSGMSLVKERAGGTLERLLMSPLKRHDVILGYTAGYSIFAVVQAVFIVLYSVFVLGLSCEGNALWVILTMLLMAIAAVAFGAMISIFSNSEFQVVQMIPVVIIPQVFFSGLIPLDTIPYGLGNIAYITPIYYGCTAIKKIMIEGAGFKEIWIFLLALFIYIVILCALNTFALRKYRRL